MKHQRIWAIVAVMVLASLACSLGGLGGGTGEPTQPPVEESTEESTEEAPTEAPPPEVASDALAGLDSYRLRITWRWTPQGGEPEAFLFEQEETRDPPAQRFVMSDPEGGDQMEWVQIGDTTWSCFGGSCVQSQENPEEAASGFGEPMAFEPEEFIGSDYRYAGKETVNGISARHYVISLSPAQIAAFAQGEVSDVQAEAWIADEADLPSFVIRYVLRWTGTREGNAGEGEFVYEIYDVNTPITIEPPEGATTGLPEDLPAYPNAQDLMSMQGMITFSTPDELETVAEFYQAQLPAMGWTMESQNDMGGMVMQSWTKDGRSLELMISPGEGGTSVMLTLSE